MDLNEFATKYAETTSHAKILINCDGCGSPRQVVKDAVRRNIESHGKYICRRCSMIASHAANPFTEDRKNKISEAMAGIPKSDETKKAMSISKKKFFESEAGQEAKKRLSMLAALGHAQNKFENAKRQGWYPSTKMNKWVFYGSSYELRLCWMLDQDDAVESFETQISYNWENRSRCLDFLIIYKNGTKLAIEVKPNSRLSEKEVILQISDSEAHAKSQAWKFEVYTENELEMTYEELRRWADTYREQITGIDFTEQRKESFRKKAKKHYDNKIATDKVEVYCEYCMETHTPLRLTHDRNIARNGRYICEREGGSIAGSKSKPHLKKENPFAAQGKKQCLKCSEIKTLDEFGDDKSRADGKSTRCKKCRAEIAAAKYYFKTKANYHKEH